MKSFPHCRAVSRAAFLIFLILSLPVPGEVPEPYERAIEAMRAVSHEGEGNPAAAEGWKQAVQADAGLIVPLLEGVGDANELAANWLVSAAQALVERELGAGRDLPLDEIGAFLMDTQQDPDARRMAFEWIERVDPETAATLVPGMLNDPSAALRRDAVAALLAKGKRLVEEEKRPAATIVYRQALGAARDTDQIEEAARALRSLGQPVDLPAHFGFLMNWSVIGPFDNTDRAGFDAVFPPENEIDLAATYPGKKGEVSWSELATTDDYGMVDVNKAYGPLKETTAYLYTEYESLGDRPAELRLGCKNAWKIWLNGEFIFGRDEYHRGMRIDQYRLPVTLKKGKNAILVKVCQNEQEEEWTVEWQFQLRVCDSTGTALLAVDRPPTPEVKQDRSS